MYFNPQHLKGGIMSGNRNRMLDQFAQIFAEKGYTDDFCDKFGTMFVDDKKNARPSDIIFLAGIYNKIGDIENTEFYLGMLDEKKLGNEERFCYCYEKLMLLGKKERGTDGAIFRNGNIGFIQNFMQKKNSPEYTVNMYIALAMVDCAGRRYADAFSLLKCYKPSGRNDTLFLGILITAIYIYAKMNDTDGMQAASDNARKYLKTFSSFEYSWQKAYFEHCIERAENGKI